MKLKCGFEAEALPDDEAKKINENFGNRPFRYIRLRENGYICYDNFLKYADLYYDFKFSSDDVVLMGYPRSGTTWCQEILWTMLHNPNLDNPDASLAVNRRVPFFEHDLLLTTTCAPKLEPGNIFYDAFVKEFPDKNPDNGIMLQTVESQKRPRTTKTHFLFSLLNPNIADSCKIVYIVRNPKDVIVSQFHAAKLLKDFSYTGTFEKLLSSHLENSDLTILQPYWLHVREAWEKRNHPNVHFMYYEDLKENSKVEYTRLKDFLGLSLTEKQIDDIIHYTSFDVMKNRESEKTKQHHGGYNPSAEKEGGFFRKGVVGGSRKDYTEEQEKRLDEWIKKNAEDLGPDFKCWI